MKATIFLQTFLFSFLPFLAQGFNISLSFPAEKCLESPIISKSEIPSGLYCLLQDFGKGIKESENIEKDYLIKTVVIDPGHGGHDPGCLGADSYEKDIALAIGLKLSAALKESFPDIKVIMTRDTDVFIPLHERAAIANRNGADLFISIHCNYIPKRFSVQGTETYVMGLHTAEHNLKVAKRENSAILLEHDYQKNYDYDPNSPEGHILFSMFQNAYLEQSILFADQVESKFHSVGNRHSRGVKQAGFVVLKETAMPSVLIETGFLSNKEEEDYLLTEEGQELISGSLLKAFEAYKSIVESGKIPEVAAKELVYKSPAAAKAKPKESPKKVPVKVQVQNATGTTTNSPPKAIKPTPPHQQVPVYRESRIIPMQPYEQSTVQPKGISPSRAQNKASFQKEKISFHVQLAASPNPMPPDQQKWENLGYLIEVVEEDNLYKYQARNFTSLQQAFEARLLVQSRGFPDAFIVAYKNGERISMQEAREALGR